MSNARNLANLLGTGTTIASAKIADDAITNAKILNDAVTGAKIEDNPTIAGNLTIAGNATAQGTTSGFGDDDKIILNATDGSATDAGDNLVLNSTDGSSDDGDGILFENFTNDGSAVLETSQKVLQVVTSTTTTEVTNNTTSEAATGLSANIIPSSSSNKVLAMATIPIQRGSNSGNITADYNLKRGDTIIGVGDSMINVNAIVQIQDEISITKLDEPNTTSETTYSVTFKETTQTGRYGNTMVCSGNSLATLILMEISG